MSCNVAQMLSPCMHEVQCRHLNCSINHAAMLDV